VPGDDEPGPDGHYGQSARSSDELQASRGTGKPCTKAGRSERPHGVRNDGDNREHEPEEEDLGRHVAIGPVDELGKDGGEKNDRLRVCDPDNQALSERTPVRGLLRWAMAPMPYATATTWTYSPSALPTTVSTATLRPPASALETTKSTLGPGTTITTSAVTMKARSVSTEGTSPLYEVSGPRSFRCRALRSVSLPNGCHCSSSLTRSGRRAKFPPGTSKTFQPTGKGPLRVLHKPGRENAVTGSAPTGD